MHSTIIGNVRFDEQRKLLRKSIFRVVSCIALCSKVEHKLVETVAKEYDRSVAKHSLWHYHE